MKKSKGQTVDLLYINEKETSKKTKKKPKNTTKKKSTAKTKKNNNDRINLDNEIIIGLTPKKEQTKKKEKNVRSQKTKKKTGGNTKGHSQKNSNKNHNKKSKKNIGTTNKNLEKNKTKNQSPKRKRNLKITKWLLIIILVLVIVILFMMSSIFNIKKIVVLNNSKISSEEIISLSTLTPGINMFRTTNRTIKNNIKTNAYIEDVRIKRNVNGTITLDVKERKPTYMLKLENTYAYINNQGYILEISKNPLKTPIITGFKTSNEEVKEGNRLAAEDLSKLDDIIKIMESVKNSILENIITEIDISNSMNYKLVIASEGKTVQFGDTNNINIKLQMISQIFSAEKGKTGEIYFQEDAKKAIFKEEVSR